MPKLKVSLQMQLLLKKIKVKIAPIKSVCGLFCLVIDIPDDRRFSVFTES